MGFVQKIILCVFFLNQMQSDRLKFQKYFVLKIVESDAIVIVFSTQTHMISVVLPILLFQCI
jgi:hypothetical protein